MSIHAATFPRVTNETNTWEVVLDAVNSATKNIYIGSFLWRDDELGNEIAEAVLRAAERGVRVEIDKDAAGVFHEWAEGSHQSFFHTRRDIKAYTYLLVQRPRLVFQNRYNVLRKSIIEHQNVVFSSKKKPFIDHMKGIEIDDVFISGGMNIGDEYKIWNDLMLHVNTSDGARARIGRVLDATESGESILPVGTEGEIRYLRDIPNYNRKTLNLSQKSALGIIGRAKRNIRILGGYLSSPEIVNALIEKSWEDTNISITIVLPARSNLQQWDIQNSITKIESEGRQIHIAFTDNMIHAKCIQGDDDMTLLTSANFDRMSGNFTGELGTEISGCTNIQAEITQYFQTLIESSGSGQESLSLKFRSRSIQNLVESLLQRAILSKTIFKLL